MMQPLARQAALGAALLVPAIALAQGRQLNTHMSASVSQIYDGNLFAAPDSVSDSASTQSDLITRVGPAVDVEYRTRQLFTTARYELQAERYARHSALTSGTSHQDASIGLRYQASKLLSTGLTAGYVRTQTPSELNVDSELGVGRAPADRVSVISTAGYNLSKATKLTGEYAFGRDRLIGLMSNAAHRSRVGVLRRADRRNSYRFDYEFRNFETGVAAWSASHVVTAGWAHELTPRTGVDIMAGPRFTEGVTRPEISAALRHSTARAEYSLRYTSTELTTIGETGPVEVQRVAMGARYQPVRWCALTAAPVLATNVRRDAHVTVYALDFESMFDVTRRLSLIGWGRAGTQHGTLSGSTGAIPYRTFGVTLKIAPPHAAR